MIIGGVNGSGEVYVDVDDDLVFEWGIITDSIRSSPLVLESET